jgi:hypothetical protein
MHQKQLFYKIVSFSHIHSTKIYIRSQYQKQGFNINDTLSRFEVKINVQT